MRAGFAWLALAIAILLSAGAASLYFSFQPDPATQPVARAPAPAPAPATATAPTPAPATPAPSAPAPAAPARPLVAEVDSVEAGYPLSDWQRGRGGFGWIDGLALSAGQALPERPLTDSDVLELGGWAGDVDLGLRARFVLVAVCGRVIATPDVGLPRPDVAESVHPNLGASGWRARVAIKHLPRCAEPQLEVWGPVGPFQFAVPLEGARALNLAPQGGAAPTMRSPAQLRRPPSSVPSLRRTTVQGQGNVNLRRCPGTSCTTVGQLAAGAHQAIVIEEAAEWVLLAVPASGRTGWIARRLVRIE